MATLTTDEILIQLNPFGRIQKAFFFSVTYMQFFIQLLDQSIVFLGATPDHHCTLPDGYSINQTIPLEKDVSGDVVYSQCREYEDPGNPNTNETQNCQNGWDHSREFYGDTIISEWDLVCTSNPVSETSQSIMQVGAMLGAIVFGTIADSYGRRFCLLSSLIIYNIAGLAICFSLNFPMFCVLRFFAAFGEVGTHLTLISVVSEYMIPKYRNVTTIVPNMAMTCGLMFMALMAYFIRDWRYLQLVLQVPVIAATFGLWFLPESLRWLLSKNMTEKAEVLIQKLARINGADVPKTYFADKKTSDLDEREPEISVELTNSPSLSSDKTHLKRNVSDCDNEQSPHFYRIREGGGLPIGPAGKDNRPLEQDSQNNISNDDHEYSSEHPPTRKTGVPEEGGLTNSDTSTIYGQKIENFENSDGSGSTKTREKTKMAGKSYLDLFKPPVLHVTIVISIFRSTIALVYFGFALNTGNLAGNPYFNFFLSALVEVPSILLSPIVYKWFRRTYITSACFVMCFAALITIAFSPTETKNGTDLGMFIVGMSLVGKFFVTLSMAALLLLIMELFPTSLRNIGNGFTMCMGRIGAMVAPLMLYADAYIPNFSPLLMASMSLLTAVTILTLPDTRTTYQPQDIANLRDLFKNKKANEEKSGVENKSFDDTKL